MYKLLSLNKYYNNTYWTAVLLMTNIKTQRRSALRLYNHPTLLFIILSSITQDTLFKEKGEDIYLSLLLGSNETEF